MGTMMPRRAKRTVKGRLKRPPRMSLGNVYECPFCNEKVSDVTAHVDETPACRRKRRGV